MGLFVLKLNKGLSFWVTNDFFFLVPDPKIVGSRRAFASVEENFIFCKVGASFDISVF
jgi:hypothetical protein